MEEKTDYIVGTDKVIMATEDSRDDINDTKEELASYENPMPVNPIA